LTREYVAGRRARYLSPVRLYLIVSVMYFLAASAAPTSLSSGSGQVPAPGIKIGVTGRADNGDLTAEERAAMLKHLDESSSMLRPLLRSMATDPVAFRARVLTIMPRVFFALLPVFAVIVALFYRGRPFPTSLVFAAHLHAFAFIVFTLTEASKFTGSLSFALTVSSVAGVAFAIYALKALRVVFGGGWGITIAKALAIGAVYSIASLPAFAVILAWASLSS
jgi:hypothetical protein